MQAGTREVLGEEKKKEEKIQRRSKTDGLKSNRRLEVRYRQQGFLNSFIPDFFLVLVGLHEGDEREHTGKLHKAGNS